MVELGFANDMDRVEKAPIQMINLAGALIFIFLFNFIRSGGGGEKDRPPF